MNSFFSLVKTLFKAAIFFTLFAFALNNQADVTVHFFFGYQWTAPLVLLVLIVFSAGLLFGVLGMVPRWWRQRRVAAQARQRLEQPTAAVSDSALADANRGALSNGL